VWDHAFEAAGVATQPLTAPACHSWPVLSPDELRERRFAQDRVDAGDKLWSPELEEHLRANWDGLAALYEWQDDRCAVCGTKRGSLMVDHDHETALVRGLLCGTCNTREGMGRQGAFAAYRQNPPAAILGVREVYYSPLTGYAEPEPPETDDEMWARTKALWDKMGWASDG
jgi:hypothetical protein